MKAAATMFALALALAPAARADTSAAATADVVRAADIAFEKLNERVGLAEAFRQTMDETDGLWFGAGAPTRGAAAIYAAAGGAAPTKARLQWTPADAWGSKGGDMGVTTGTYRFTPSGPDGPVSTGRYVTVWRRNAAGAWKGLIDIGNPDPK